MWPGRQGQFIDGGNTLAQHRFGFMLKTYRPDLPYVSRFVESFNAYNADAIPLTLVVPQSDGEMFSQFVSDTIDIVFDEDLPVRYADKSSDDQTVGIRNAGVSKLGFGLIDKYDFYFCVDSELELIRPFFIGDFFDSSGKAYIVAFQSLELSVDPFYFSRYGDQLGEAIRVTSDYFGWENPLRLGSHACQIMSSRVIVELVIDFLMPRKLDLLDLMLIEIWEFFWYTSWALSHAPQDFVRRDEFVRIVHHQGDHLVLNLMGVKKNDLARAYLGVLVNSNWSRQYGIVDFDHPPTQSYLTSGAWAEWSKARSAPWPNVEDAARQQ